MKLTLVIAISLWSSLASTADDGEFNFSKISDESYLKISHWAFYKQIDNSKDYSTNYTEKNVITVNNMPAVRNMDGQGLCSACGPATVIQKMECDIKKIKNCSDNEVVNNKERVNLLGLYAQNDYGRPDILRASGQFNAKNSMISPKYLPDTAIDFIGGDPYNILKNVKNANFELYTDACYPFDQFANSINFKDPNRKGIFDTKKSDPIFTALEEQYKNARIKLKLDQTKSPDLKDPNTANELCEDCITQLQSQIYDLGKVQLETKILGALKQETFATFLYVALFGNCYDQLKKFPKPKEIMSYPKYSEELTAHDLFNKITDTLKQQKPIIIQDACVLKSKQDSDLCIGLHSTTISGIKDVCEKNNPNNCKKYFRIHECKGQDWKEEYGEWFEADRIINNISPANADRVQLANGVAYPKYKSRSSPDEKIKYSANTLVWLDY